MTDLFITTLEQPLESWSLAFTPLRCSAGLLSKPTYHEPIPAVIWLHLQGQPKSWLKAMMEGVQALYPLSRVVVLANDPKSSEAMFALGLGAGAYVHAYTNIQSLQEIKKVVLHGGVWLGSELLKRLIDASLQMVNDDVETIREDLLELLTKREREVCIAASKGLSNKEIARALNITERTVKAHLSAVFETLKVKDRLHLALVLHGQQRNHSAVPTALQANAAEFYLNTITHGQPTLQS